MASVGTSGNAEAAVSRRRLCSLAQVDEATRQSLQAALHENYDLQNEIASACDGIARAELQAEGDALYVQDVVQVTQSWEALRKQAATEPLSTGRLAHLGLQLCRALTDMFGRGDLGRSHGALRPDCILLSGQQLLLSDCGVRAADAVLGSDSYRSLFGLGPYCAPETWDPGYEWAEPADQFAIGVLLYELATGAHPYGLFEEARADVFGCMGSLAVGIPPSPAAQVSPQIDSRLAEILDRAVAEEAARRHTSLAEFTGLLEPLVARPALSEAKFTELMAAFAKSLIVAGACDELVSADRLKMDWPNPLPTEPGPVSVSFRMEGTDGGQAGRLVVADIRYSADPARITSPQIDALPDSLRDDLRGAVLTVQQDLLQENVRAWLAGLSAQFPDGRILANLAEPGPTCIAEWVPIESGGGAQAIEVPFSWDMARCSWTAQVPPELTERLQEICRSHVATQADAILNSLVSAYGKLRKFVDESRVSIREVTLDEHAASRLMSGQAGALTAKCEVEPLPGDEDARRDVESHLALGALRSELQAGDAVNAKQAGKDLYAFVDGQDRAFQQKRDDEEKQRIAEENRKQKELEAEAARKRKEAERVEAERRAEEKRKKDQEKKEEQQRLAEEKRIEQQKQKEEAARLAEQKRIETQQRKEQEKREREERQRAKAEEKAEAKRRAAEEKQARAKEKAEAKREAAEKKQAEAERQAAEKQRERESRAAAKAEQEEAKRKARQEREAQAAFEAKNNESSRQSPSADKPDDAIAEAQGGRKGSDREHGRRRSVMLAGAVFLLVAAVTGYVGWSSGWFVSNNGNRPQRLPDLHAEAQGHDQILITWEGLDPSAEYSILVGPAGGDRAAFESIGEVSAQRGSTSLPREPGKYVVLLERGNEELATEQVVLAAPPPPPPNPTFLVNATEDGIAAEWKEMPLGDEPTIKIYPGNDNEPATSIRITTEHGSQTIPLSAGHYRVAVSNQAGEEIASVSAEVVAKVVPQPEPVEPEYQITLTSPAAGAVVDWPVKLEWSVSIKPGSAPSKVGAGHSVQLLVNGAIVSEPASPYALDTLEFGQTVTWEVRVVKGGEPKPLQSAKQTFSTPSAPFPEAVNLAWQWLDGRFADDDAWSALADAAGKLTDQDFSLRLAYTGAATSALRARSIRLEVRDKAANPQADAVFARSVTVSCQWERDHWTYALDAGQTSLQLAKDLEQRFEAFDTALKFVQARRLVPAINALDDAFTPDLPPAWQDSFAGPLDIQDRDPDWGWPATLTTQDGARAFRRVAIAPDDAAWVGIVQPPPQQPDWLIFYVETAESNDSVAMADISQSERLQDGLRLPTALEWRLAAAGLAGDKLAPAEEAELREMLWAHREWCSMADQRAYCGGMTFDCTTGNGEAAKADFPPSAPRFPGGLGVWFENNLVWLTQQLDPQADQAPAVVRAILPVYPSGFRARAKQQPPPPSTNALNAAANDWPALQLADAERQKLLGKLAVFLPAGERPAWTAAHKPKDDSTIVLADGTIWDAVARQLRGAHDAPDFEQVGPADNADGDASRTLTFTFPRQLITEQPSLRVTLTKRDLRQWGADNPDSLSRLAQGEANTSDMTSDIKALADLVASRNPLVEKYVMLRAGEFPGWAASGNAGDERSFDAFTASVRSVKISEQGSLLTIKADARLKPELGRLAGLIPRLFPNILKSQHQNSLGAAYGEGQEYTFAFDADWQAGTSPDASAWREAITEMDQRLQDRVTASKLLDALVPSRARQGDMPNDLAECKKIMQQVWRAKGGGEEDFEWWGDRFSEGERLRKKWEVTLGCSPWLFIEFLYGPDAAYAVCWNWSAKTAITTGFVRRFDPGQEGVGGFEAKDLLPVLFSDLRLVDLLPDEGDPQFGLGIVMGSDFITEQQQDSWRSDNFQKVHLGTFTSYLAQGSRTLADARALTWHSLADLENAKNKWPVGFVVVPDLRNESN